MQKSKLNAVNTVCLLVLGLGGVFFVANRTSSARPQVAQSLETLHLSGVAKQVKHSRWRADRMHQVGMNGLASGRAGFFLLAPSMFEGADYNSSVSDLEGDRLFWGVPGRLPIFHYMLTGPLDPAGYLSSSPPPGGSVKVEIDWLFHNRWVSNPTVSPSADYPGRHSVWVDMDQAAVDMLVAMHGPSSSSAPFVDWFGRTVAPGGQATRMVATLVADTVAHDRVDLSAIVANGIPATFRCADDLTFAEAQQLVDRLQP